MARQIFTALATLAGLFVLAWLATGCAKHADFLEMREELHAVVRAQNQAAKQQEALQRRLQSLETKQEAKPAASRGVEAEPAALRHRGRDDGPVEVPEQRVALGAAVREGTTAGQAGDHDAWHTDYHANLSL